MHLVWRKVDCSHDPISYSMGSFSEAQLVMRL
jgi:hypothetical protein